MEKTDHYKYSSYTFDESWQDEEDRLLYGFKVLDGVLVKNLYLSENKTVIKIVDEDDNEYYFECVGDCCNSVWVEHISGIDNLVNGLVNNIDNPNWFFLSGKQEVEVDYDNFDNQFTDEYWESLDSKNIDCGFFSIKTDLGNIIIELRNSYSYYAYAGGILYRDSSYRETMSKFKYNLINFYKNLLIYHKIKR